MLLIATGALGVVGYFFVAMPGMNHGARSGDPSAAMGSMDHTAMSFVRMNPDAFARALLDRSAFVVNVHTPYNGEIDRTDAFISYESIGTDDLVPADKDTPILLYCRTGRMSAAAAEELVAAGYVNVAHLEGGMDAWQSDGMDVRTLEQSDAD